MIQVENGEDPDKPAPSLKNILNDLNQVKFKDTKRDDEFDMELEMNFEK